MPWTYNTNVTSDRDKVRLIIGDTIGSDPQLDDGEVDFLLTTAGSVHGAAIGACRALVAKYARLCDKWVGDLKILAGQKQLHYTRLLELLSAPGSAPGSIAIPSAGGISVAQKTAYEADEDRSVPFFKRGQDDYRE